MVQQMPDTHPEPEQAEQATIDQLALACRPLLKSGLQPLEPRTQAAAGTLLARQVALAEQLAAAPSAWNGHAAPLFLQAMGRVHITLSWVLAEPGTRARRFILGGLASEQQYLNRRWVQLESGGIPADGRPGLEAIGSWIDRQRGLFEEDGDQPLPSSLPALFEMAQQARCLEFYEFFYSAFGPCPDSSWQHLGRYHLKPCSNPEHPFHVVTADAESPDLHYLTLAAACLRSTKAALEEHLNSIPAASD